MQEIDPAIPPALDRVVTRCLAKDPEERWQSSRDLLWHLTMIAQDAVSADSPRPRLAFRAHAVWAAVTLVMAMGIGLAVWNGAAARPQFVREPVRMHFDLPAGDRLAPGFYPSLALSPNGTQLVFRSEAQGPLFVGRLDRFEAQSIPGTEGAHTPFFSPDGKWIGFLAEGKVMRVPIVGGLPQKICDAPSLSPGSPGAAWGPDDTIVFAAGVEGLMRVDANGGVPERLTVPNVQWDEITHHGPQFLPGGKELLFTIRTVEGKSRVAVLSLASRQWDSLPIDEMVGAARYVGTGHLVYAQNSQTGRLLAVPFDLSRRTITGIPLPQRDQVYTQAAVDVMVAQFTVSDSGVLACVTGRRPQFTLVKATPDGARPLTDDAHTYRYPRVSGDGRQIAVSITEDRSDIYVVDAERGTLRSITTLGSNTAPTWTSDGRRIVFASTRRGSHGYDIYSIPADEGADPEPLVVREGSQFPSSWSPTAPVLTFYELNNDTARDIWVWKSEQREAEKVLGTRPNERSATFSADGHWLAYVSDQLGERDEVYIQRYPGPGGRQRVSKDGGTEPVWSRSGHELFYRRGRQLLAVRIDTAAPQVVLGASRLVFEGPYELSAAEVGRPNYDVFPDGSFVMVRSEEKTPDRHVHVVLDWFEELKAGFQGKR